MTSKRSVGEFWKNVKPLLPCTNKGRNDDNIILIDNGKLVDDPASVFNKYFTTPLIEESILSMNENDYIDHPSVQLIKDQNFNLNFHFNPISSTYIYTLLQNVDVKKGGGPDGITPRIFKIAAPAIMEPITKLFNYCILSSSCCPLQMLLLFTNPMMKLLNKTIVP